VTHPASEHDERGAATALRHKSRGTWRSWTWQDQSTAVERLAAGWRALGVASGDRVLFLAGNRPRALWSLLAVRAIGATGVVVDPESAPERLAELVDWLGVRFVHAAGETQVDAVLEAGGAGLSRVVFEDGRGLGGRSDSRLVSYDLLQRDPRVARVVDPPPLEVAELDGQGWRIVRVEADGVVEVGPGDEVMLVEPLATPASLLLLLRWLQTGFRLSLAESPQSVAGDLRELAPSYLAASSSFFTRLHQGVVERSGAPRSLRHRLIGWGLRGVGTFSGWLVRRPLARLLGLARVRIADATGAELTAQVRAFFTALGTEVRVAPGPAALPVEWDTARRNAL
jgi:long-subunit acyl-CoA synthetase (AMP-forming)